LGRPIRNMIAAARGGRPYPRVKSPVHSWHPCPQPAVRQRESSATGATITGVFTIPAARSFPDVLDNAHDTVVLAAELRRNGWTPASIRAQLDARRWQRNGRALVLHNGPLQSDERRRVALLNCGPRSVLTAFTAAEEHGLEGWEREQIHVLVPAGARIAPHRDRSLRVHYTSDWSAVPILPARRLHQPAAALLVAAGTFAKARPACGILAAGVQQRLVSATQFQHALDAAPRVRHHALLLSAARDIAQGAEALSEIDFVRLCRRFRLPQPRHQAVRAEPGGRRRYLDAEWRCRDGRVVAAEVDGALHLTPRRWWDDQLRQNELTIAGTLVLRFPSAVVRAEPALVADQLRRLLRS
jgi:hypothetical protein